MPPFAAPWHDLSGRVALITGAGRGLGAAITRALAASGARVVLWGRRRRRLERLAAQLPSQARPLVQAVDVTEPAAIRRAVRGALRATRRLDILVNNAGIWGGDPVRTLSAATWNDVLQTDLTGVLFVTQAVLPAMMRRRYGKIIHISSTSGFIAYPHGAAYGAAKAGLIHLTRIMAVELGPSGIRVNSIAPGLFRTDMTADMFSDRRWLAKRRRDIPLRRFGEADDLGALAVFLSGAGSDYITGQTIVIDGGASLT